MQLLIFHYSLSRGSKSNERKIIKTNSGSYTMSLYLEIIQLPSYKFTIVHYSIIDPPMPHIIISISDTDENRPKVPRNQNCFGVLNLCFHDTDKEFQELIDPNDESRTLFRHMKLMTSDDADKILDCEGGMCRSPATAAAISYIFNGKGREETFFQRFLPNRHVFSTILNRASDRNLF